MHGDVIRGEQLAAEDLPDGSVTHVRTQSVALGDVDGDGRVDIVVANSNSDYGGAPNQLLLGSAMGGFEEAVTLPGGSLTTTSVALGDIDGDGHLDIVFANNRMDLAPAQAAPNQLLLGRGNGSPGGPNQLLLGSSTGDFASPVTLPGGS